MDILNPHELASRAADARRRRDAATVSVASLATLEALARIEEIVPPLSEVIADGDTNLTDS